MMPEAMLAAMAVVLLLGVLIRRFSAVVPGRNGLVERPTYRYGGPAVAAAVTAGCAVNLSGERGILADVFYQGEALRLLLAGLGGALLLAAAAAFILDRRPQRGYRDWLVMLPVCAAACWSPLSIREISIPLAGTVELGAAAGWLGTVFWFLLVIGTAEVLEALARWCLVVPFGLASAWYAVTAPPGEYFQQTLAGCLAAALGMQAVLNVKSPGIAQGGTGVKVTGFLFAVLTLVSRQKAHAAVFILFPILACLAYIVVDSLGRAYRSAQAEGERSEG